MITNILAVGLMSLGMGLNGLKDQPKQIIAENQITDLTGSSWTFNNTISPMNFPIDSGTGDQEVYIHFTSNNTNYTSLYWWNDYDEEETWLCYWSPKTDVYNQSSNQWQNNNYKSIDITEGDAVQNTTLISWLYTNATLTAYNPPQNDSESSETSENSEPTPTPSSESGMGADIIGGITSGLGIISPLALSFLSGFGALFWDATNQVLSPFAIFSLVMLGLAISFAIIKLVMHIIRSNTGA